MPRANDFQPSFNAGELSPRMAARVDFAKYPAGCATVKNMLPLPQGGLARRPGTRFVGTLKDQTAVARLLRFEFSTTQAYVVEAGDTYFRFYRNQGQIVSNDVEGSVTNGDFPTDIANWTDKSVGGTPAAKISHNATLFTMNLDRAGGGTAHAEQQITNTTAQENVVKFRVIGAPGDKIKLRVGTSTGASDIVSDVEFAVGYHAYAFTPTAANFFLQFIFDGSNKIVQIDDVSVIDAAAIELQTPYTTTQLSALKTAQTADVMYITHPSHPVHKLTRGGHTSWSLVEVAWDDGPYLDENTTATTMTLSAATVGVGRTLTASAVTGVNDGEGFKSTDVGRLFRSSNNATANEYGWGVITGFTSATVVTIDIKRAFPVATAVDKWSLGAWSATTGYPSTVGFYEQRAVYASTATQPQTLWFTQSADLENMRPDSFESGNTVENDDALNFTIAAKEVNIIRWTSSGTVLVIGTTGGEWIAESDGPILTPTDIQIRRHTTEGSGDIEPARVNNVVLFVQKAGRQVDEFAFNFEADAFRANPMTDLATHITRSGVTEIAYQQQPDSVVWAVRGDGVLAAMTFRRGQDVVAWSRHVLGGSFGTGNAQVESITTIPGNNGTEQVRDSTERDEVWVIVKRAINGATTRYVEFLEGSYEGPERNDFTNEAAWEAQVLADMKDAYYADSLLTYDGVATTQITNLDHLEGETVKILADGKVHPDKVVTGGSVTLDFAASKVHVGLGYTHQFRSLKITAGAAAGTGVGRVKRIHEIVLVLQDAPAFKIGPDFETLRDVEFLDTGDLMDTAIPLFTGERRESFGGDYGRDPRVVIQSDNPLPFTLLALAPSVKTQDGV